MRRRTLNLLALTVLLMGGLTLGGTGSLGAQEGDSNVVCCPGAGGSCCGRECKSSADGSCESCGGFWSCLFL